MRDREKARERQRLRREQQKIAKYGPEAAGKNMSGRHGNHARGVANARFRGGRFVTSGGYVAIRVEATHPHAWGAHPSIKYAYEHIIVAEQSLGRAIGEDELVHHINGDKQDNRPENLEVMTRAEHAVEHSILRGRNELGQFPKTNTQGGAS